MKVIERLEQLESRVLIWTAPNHPDADAARRLLADPRLHPLACQDLTQVAREAARGAAVVVLIGDATGDAGYAPFVDVLNAQPAWSELPVVLLLRDATPDEIARLLSTVPGATVLELPVRAETLVHTVRAALRARRRQYEVRRQLDAAGAQPPAAGGAGRDRWFRAAIEAGRFGAFQRDLTTGRIDVSPTFREIYGLGRDEPFEYARLESLLHPDDLPRMRAAIAAAVAGEDMYRCEYRVRTREGEERWVLARGHILVTDPGTPPRMVGVALNITEQKQAEQERERLLASERDAHAQSEQANRAKDQFLAVLSHELRTPLTPVLATAQVMAADPALPDDVREAFDMVCRNIELEARLIDDLLDLTRVSRGKLEIQPTTLDLHAEIAKVAGIVESDLRAKGLSLVTELGADRPHVRADPVRLQQVLWNLLKNAIKFTPEGGTVAVRTRGSRRAKADRLVIEVQDTGVGIPPDVLPRLFNAFEQGGRETTRLFGGLGLGLAISKALVEAHGGKISVHSDGADRGATFTVDLPVAATSAPAGTGSAAPSADGTRPAAGRRILLVEDHADTARALARILAGRGHTVRTADTVCAALRAVASGGYDLVISDIGLPDGSGLDLMRQIVARRGPIPGIALSGFGMDEDVRRSRAAGFAAHLTKPVKIDQLEAALRQLAAPAATSF